MQGNFSITFADKSETPKYSDGYVSFSVEFNCYHVAIKDIDRNTGKSLDSIFTRKPDLDQWLDEDHQKLIEALVNLKKVFTAQIKKERRT